MVIPIIAGAGAILSSGIGAAKSGAANRKNRAIFDSLSSDNEASYLSEYHRGALDNDGAKAYLKRVDNQLTKQSEALENNATARGATHENILSQKQSNNEVMSSAIGGLVENEERRKEGIRQNYLNRKQELASGVMGLNSQNASNWMNFGGGVASAAGGVASAYMSGGTTMGLNRPIIENPE